MGISQKQINAVIALSGPKRYEHFIKKIADLEVVWGLYLDGWALAGMGEGIKLFPVWPQEEYALLSAAQAWSGYVPKSFCLKYFVDDLLPELERDEIGVSVFYTPFDAGVVPSFEQLREDIKKELRNY
ncbi:DUF2750 domain-containing protein [Thalassospira marina]|uniref:DUF2750 domain-containing protein n=1 Tax=Thalassospira marina TaxID=2048283 RepID=A0A2N3KEK6_9PROT|nr:DUF2750 domain-containing protein [Thalassospira marina]PKR48926.1 hypothetical protein COO20_23500 [Thalassospira marina]